MTRKIRDVTRQEFIAAIEKIAEGQTEGRTAKQLAGEILIHAKRVWRFAETREWVQTSCIERLTRKDFDARPRKRTVTLGIDGSRGPLASLGRPRSLQGRPRYGRRAATPDPHGTARE